MKLAISSRTAGRIFTAQFLNLKFGKSNARRCDEEGD
jgi:hypothetical protein